MKSDSKGYTLREWTDDIIDGLVKRATKLDENDDDNLAFEDFAIPDKESSNPYVGTIIVWKTEPFEVSDDKNPEGLIESHYAVSAMVANFCGDAVFTSATEYIPKTDIPKLKEEIKKAYEKWCNEEMIDTTLQHAKQEG